MLNKITQSKTNTKVNIKRKSVLIDPKSDLVMELSFISPFDYHCPVIHRSYRISVKKLLLCSKWMKRFFHNFWPTPYDSKMKSYDSFQWFSYVWFKKWGCGICQYYFKGFRHRQKTRSKEGMGFDIWMFTDSSKSGVWVSHPLCRIVLLNSYDVWQKPRCQSKLSNVQMLTICFYQLKFDRTEIMICNTLLSQYLFCPPI